MENETSLKKSFSAWKRWGLGLDLVVRTAVVLAVVVMVNYLGARWSHRFFLNAAARYELSPRTAGLLKSITNEVQVIVYYDQENPVFPAISTLLREYRNANSHIHLTTVDYIRDMGEATKLKENDKYKPYLTGATNKNLVLFECAGTVIPVNGQAIGRYRYEEIPNPNPDQGKYHKHLLFYGENLFTAALFAAINPKPMKACYLIGHGEPRLDDAGEAGYQTFLSVLQQFHIEVQPLSLLGTNAVPADCNLLVIAGPSTPLLESERERADDYLRQGGRLLALFNPGSLGRLTGLESILAGWGVGVTNAAIAEPKLTSGKLDLIVMSFNDLHPVVNPLIGSGLHLILPRPVGRLEVGKVPADAPQVEVLAQTSPAATLDRGSRRGPGRFPLAVAVEKRNAPGVITERGATRIIVVGDSLFLCKQMIESAGNKDFLGYAVNWLLERTELMQGLGPRPVTEYRLAMTISQQHSAQWLMLAAIPGAVLAFGGVVWLRRRK